MDNNKINDEYPPNIDNKYVEDVKKLFRDNSFDEPVFIYEILKIKFVSIKKIISIIN